MFLPTFTALAEYAMSGISEKTGNEVNLSGNADSIRTFKSAVLKSLHQGVEDSNPRFISKN